MALGLPFWLGRPFSLTLQSGKHYFDKMRTQDRVFMRGVRGCAAHDDGDVRLHDGDVSV